MMMLPRADSVVRGLVPSILDVAGMPDKAEELRQIDMLSCLCGLAKACKTLRGIHDSELPAIWEKVVGEATFWAEAALWAAASEDREMFDLCESRIVSAITSGLASVILH